MNNPNPFIPQGSLHEQKNKKRARVKIAVFTIFAINIAVLCPLLIQGCKKESPSGDSTLNSPDTNTVSNATTNTPDTNVVNTLPMSGSNATATATNMSNAVPPQVPYTPPAPPTPPVVEPTTKEYTVLKGDSFYTIAKNFHVKIKEIQAANPTVVPNKLKAGQKLQIPASATGGDTSVGSTASGATATGSTDSGNETTYVVKQKDTLTKIAKEHGVTVKALRSANHLKVDAIKVGQKLKIPQKAAPVESVATPAPVPATPQPVTIPAPAPATGGSGVGNGR